jgi:hypothetical protein
MKTVASVSADIILSRFLRTSAAALGLQTPQDRDPGLVPGQTQPQKRHSDHSNRRQQLRLARATVA